MFRTVLDSSEAEALVGGYHGDPFRILGPHLADPDAKGESRWEVRAFLPQAARAEVVVGNAAAPMKLVHPQGLFIASLEGEQQSYRLRLYRKDGAAPAELDDPYRFPPLISDFDLHLHGEGTHYRSHLTMGAHLV
ncbi:MAG: GlgB N-terminal domain-containing protein, partial [bacterium]